MTEPDAYLDERQRRILEALKDNRAELAGVYRTALRLLSGELEVSDPRTRVAFIGHCMREVMNQVLRALGRSSSPKFKPSSEDQVKELPDILARFGELELDRENDFVPVPREVATAMDMLFKAAINEKQRVKDDIASLITDDDNSNHPAVKAWNDSRKFFVKWAHLSEQDVAVSDLPSDEQIRGHISVFEELLDGVVIGFFVSLHTLENLLNEINAAREAGVPTQEEVRAVMLKIPTYQLRRVFYERLENSLWVRPLLEAGAFTNPPEPESTGDGYLRDTYWPEVSFLTRIAPEAPDDVVEVLLKLNKSNNGWVRRAVFEIGSQIPPSSSVGLRPLIKAFATTGFGWRTEPRSLVSLSINLLDGGNRKFGRWLANALFEAQLIDHGDGNRKPELLLDEYSYERELPRIIPALGEDALKTLSGWLVAYVKSSGHAGGDYDFSGMDRSSIVSRDDYKDRREDALIDAVRDLSIQSLQVDPTETLNVLLRSNIRLLRKIALYVVAETIRQALLVDGVAGEHIDAAKQLLEDQSSYDEYLRVEYSLLARVTTRAESSTTMKISAFLARAFANDQLSMRKRLARQQDLTETDREETIQVKARRKRHIWLSAIGQDSLSAHYLEELSELNEIYGTIEDPLEPIGRITSWTGPNPHTSQDVMATLAPMELVVLLASWHDEGDGWGPEPSHEGQGRALSGLLTTNPLALRGVRQLGNQLRPTYLRAILHGWETAFKADLELDLSQVSELIEFVLNQPLASPFPVEGGDFDDDKDYGGAKSAAIGLLEELLKKQDSNTVPFMYEERFARLLIDCSDDEDAWTKYDSYRLEGSRSDPLNMSLNWQWPSRIRALIVAATSVENSSWQDDALKEIEAELSRVDQHGAGRAALGEGLGRLIIAAPDWIKAHLNDLVGTRYEISVEQQIVLTTAMARHRYSYTMYEILTPAMLAAIQVGDDLVAGWKGVSEPLSRIGEWVIEALVLGHISEEDPVFDAFFSMASPRVRGDALGKIAWSFCNTESVEEPIRDRFAALWDDRISHVRAHPQDSKELEGIYWLAKSASFSSEWWLPRMRDALELEPTIATERYMIGKELAQASTTDPAAALELLKLLLSERGEGGRVAFDLSRHAIPVVIGNAMLVSDEDLNNRAEVYMNKLGAQGNLELEGQVQAVLIGKVGVNDIID